MVDAMAFPFARPGCGGPDGEVHQLAQPAPELVCGLVLLRYPDEGVEQHDRDVAGGDRRPGKVDVRG
jgi:hypothetical protein